MAVKVDDWPLAGDSGEELICVSTGGLLMGCVKHPVAANANVARAIANERRVSFATHRYEKSNVWAKPVSSRSSRSALASAVAAPRTSRRGNPVAIRSPREEARRAV